MTRTTVIRHCTRFLYHAHLKHLFSYRNGVSKSTIIDADRGVVYLPGDRS